MRGAIREYLLNRLPWLFNDLGFHITAHDYSYKAMGSSFAVLESTALRAKFVYDGSSTYVEVASLSDPDRWMELGFLWMSLTGDRPNPQLDGWAWFLRDRLAQLTQALGPDFEKTKAGFEDRVRESAEIAERHTAPLRRSARLHTFLRGPLGWAVAAVLIIWIVVK